MDCQVEVQLLQEEQLEKEDKGGARRRMRGGEKERKERGEKGMGGESRRNEIEGGRRE